MGALTGTKVLEFTHFIAGPYCGQTLADHGAEVIKIEPLDGELSRKSNPFYKNTSIYYETMNRNKRNLAINMKSEQSKEVISKLIKEADVLITNYSIGIPERLGIGYEQISQINPGIIMVHITGFGLSGPLKNDSAFDGVIQAMSGIAHLTGEKGGPPLKAGIFIADYIAAFNATIGVLLGLQSREQTRKGQLVDVSMLDSMVSMMLTNLSEVSLLNKSPKRSGSRSNNVFAATFPSKNGYLYLAPLTNKMWEDFCEIVEIEALSAEGNKFSTTNGKLDNYDELEGIISAWTKEHTTENIIALMSEKRIPCGKVNSIEDLLENEQLKSRDMLLNIDFKDSNIISPGIPIKLTDEDYIVNRAPNLGENTNEILKEVGFSEEEIKLFIDSDVVGIWDK